MEGKPLVIIVAQSSDFTREVIEGFCAERAMLQQETTFDIAYTYIDDVDFSIVGQKVQDVIQCKPVVVVTIGSVCSQVVAYAFLTQKIKTPLIFCDVPNPTALGFDQMMHSSELCMSGIGLGLPSYKTIARILWWLKPSVKSVVMPYSAVNEGGVLTNAAHLIKEFLEQKAVRVTLVPLKTQSDMLSIIESKLMYADTLLSLEGCLVDRQYAEILKLCASRGITYFASSLEAVQAGAALGFIPNPVLIGTMAFRRVLHTVVSSGQKFHGVMTLLKHEGRRVAVNVSTAPQQGVYLSEERLYLMNYVKIVGTFYHLIDHEESV